MTHLLFQTLSPCSNTWVHMGHYTFKSQHHLYIITIFICLALDSSRRHVKHLGTVLKEIQIIQFWKILLFKEPVYLLEGLYSKISCFLKYWPQRMTFFLLIHFPPPSTRWDVQLACSVAFLTYYDKWSLICLLKKTNKIKNKAMVLFFREMV